MDISPVVSALIQMGPGLARLAADQYGNYVVQHALNLSGTQLQQTLVEHLMPSLPMLSTSKSGSNVAEVLTNCATADQLDAARSLLQVDQRGPHPSRPHPTDLT